MKKIQWICLTIVLVFVCCLSGSPVLAEEKIGFFSLEQVMKDSTEGKKAVDAITNVANKSKAAIQPKEDELKKLKDELDKQRNVMDPKVLREKETTFQKKLRDFQILVKDSNEELQAKQDEISKEFVPEIMKIVRGIGEKEKYTLIIEVTQFPVPFWDKAKDLTKRITDEFNKTYKPRK